MSEHKKHMNRCLELAKKGLGKVAPNPMVGCVIVNDNQVIGEGYHQAYGEAHAEVNAINSVSNKSLLSTSTLYVNLEPCAHHGKTPPCADLIIESAIPKVVIGCKDSYAEVAGKGIVKLQDAGINVEPDVLESRCLELNKRFFTFHEKQRPYLILKWAQTSDGFIDIDRSEHLLKDNWITSQASKVLIHQWRSEEAAILIGTNTALNDNPELTVREVEGRNPIRIVIDKNLRLPNDIHLFDGSTPTLVFNNQKNEKKQNLEFVRLSNVESTLQELLNELYKRGIQSLIVEGGAQLLNTFIAENLWDEARVFTGKKTFGKGLKAPTIHAEPISTLQYDTDTLSIYKNG